MSAVKPGSLRVVLDTNVYFSAFTHPQGVAYKIWRQAVSKRYTLLISPAMIRELADVLRTGPAWPESEVVAHLKLIARAAEIVEPRIVLDVITDPDDNRILECAVDGRANLIVSGDRHLTQIKSFQGISIVRPSDFKRILGL